MDSMKSLDTSLPKSRRRKQSAQPPEQLVQAFKTAALSVTNLYKTAATDQKEAREAGYQEALDDLLIFIDREDIGLDDGEGWRIRQWATERLDSSSPIAAASDSDEERDEATKRPRNSSPIVQRLAEQDQPRRSSRSTSPAHLTPALAPTSTPSSSSPVGNSRPPTEVFTFCATHPYPQDIDMQVSDSTELNQTSSTSHLETLTSSTVRLGLVPRGTRSAYRNGRNVARSTPSARVPASTGSKRKMPYLDYFDIGNFGDGKDAQGGGGKRGRFT